MMYYLVWLSILSTTTNAFSTRPSFHNPILNPIRRSSKWNHHPRHSNSFWMTTSGNDDGDSPPNNNKVIEIQRTIFRLNPSVSSSIIEGRAGSSFQLEEQIRFEYSESEAGDDNDVRDVSLGTKTYILRGTPSTAPLPPRPDDDDGDSSERRIRKRMVRVGPPLFEMALGEVLAFDEDAVGVPEENYSGPGTGARAWEASIAMSLFFAARPDLLRGKCIELGSGVGLGGIMSIIAAGLGQVEDEKTHPQTQRPATPPPTPAVSIEDIARMETNEDDGNNDDDTATPLPPNLHSITLTDSNLQVLEQCHSNAQQIPLTPPKFQIGELNWYQSDQISLQQQFSYQTILASDCAYLYPDVKPLARTMAYLLSTANDGGVLHTFGPFNRDAMRDLQTELERRYRMDVDLGLLEMECFVSEPELIRPRKEEEEEEDVENKGEEEPILVEYTSKKTTNFLYIEAQHHEDFYGEGEMFFRADDDGNRYALEPETEGDKLW